MTTIEIAERVVVSAVRSDIPQSACPVCARAMITPEAAAALAQVTVRSIYARIEAASVHFLETPNGLLLLCANSLEESSQSDALQKLVRATNPSSANYGNVQGEPHEVLDT